MKPIAMRVAHRLAHRRRGAVESYFEVPAQRGVPDLVIADFINELSSRPQVTEASALAVWLTATDLVRHRSDQEVTTRELALATGMSLGHVSGNCLPRLREVGFTEQLGRGRWRILELFRDRTRTLVTVELKRRDWRQGIRQAALHGRGADRAWLVMDASAFAHDPDQVRTSECRSVAVNREIGVATVQQGGRLDVLAPASVGGPRAHSRRSAAISRAILAERAWHLRATGLTSGPLFPVFGRVDKSAAV